MRVFFTNLGCKLNQAELEALGRRFVDAGFGVAPALEEADLHVVNTCTVTHAAARDSRKIARRGRRLNPHLRTVLTGCHATAEPGESASLEGVDLVVPNRHKEDLVERVRAAFPVFEAPPADRSVLPPVPYVPLAFGNSRALVKIEDGCNMTCSFCIIPLTRGEQRSRPADAVVREVELLTAKGVHEVVLTGVQISAYRATVRGAERGGLYELVCRLLEETRVGRLRLTSIAPWQFDRRLLSLLETGRLCRHFHLSLQSGCDRTLRRMRRPYSANDFASVVEAIRGADPDVAVTTDVIAGFPGETNLEFEESLAFCAAVGFSRLHAFPFSARPGTEAATLPNPVPHPVQKKRMGRLLRQARADEQRFLGGQTGRRAEVLWERKRHGAWAGVTDNYVRVLCASDGDLGGRVSAVRLGAARNGAVAGHLDSDRRPARRALG